MLPAPATTSPETTSSARPSAPRTAYSNPFAATDHSPSTHRSIAPPLPAHRADGVTCALNRRSHHPVLIDAGFTDLQIPIPWWHGPTLRLRFPPR